MIRNKIAAFSLAAIALSFGASSSARAANLVQNGGFASNNAYTSNGNGQVGFNTTLTDWTMAGSPSYTFLFTAGTADTTGSNGQYGNVSLWGSHNGGANTITASPDGGFFIAQDPAFQSAAIQQSISGLTQGQQYLVSFYWGAAQQFGPSFVGPTTDSWTVSLGSESHTTNTINLPSKGFSGWTQQTFTFTATGATETLSFLANGGPSGSVPPFALLDGVTMTAVPEPSTLSLFALGLLGVIGLRRRSQRMRA
jgi:hypothetical protein